MVTVGHVISVALFSMYIKARIFKIGMVGCCYIDSMYTNFQGNSIIVEHYRMSEMKLPP